MQQTTLGIVIKEKTVESDRILTLLTQDYGVLTAYARGAQKLRGRLTSSTELLCLSRFVLFKNRDRYTVDAADSDRSFFGIRQDIEKLSLAAYFSQLTQRLAPAEEPAGEYLRLLLNCLHLLEKGGRSQLFLKAVFELRILTMAGFMPDLVGCRDCGAFEKAPMAFLPESGELLCPDCPPTKADGPRYLLPPGVLAAMRHILYSEMGSLFAFTLSPEGLIRLGEVCERYLRIQLDMPLPTLEFYHSLFPGGVGGMAVPTPSPEREP